MTTGMFWLIVIGAILAVGGVAVILALIDYRSGSVPGGGTPLGMRWNSCSGGWWSRGRGYRCSGGSSCGGCGGGGCGG